MNIAINKDRIHELPLVTFPGNIYVIDSMYHIDEVIQVLRHADIVGFDTETRPSFRRGPMRPPALLQLSTLNDCFLFRLNKIHIPDILSEYLTDFNCKKVGLSVSDDFMALNRIHPIRPEGFIDLQDMVKQYHINDLSLQKIYAILFGEKISKNQRLTNWEASELSEAQIRYAAIDAWACTKIYHYLNEGKFDPSTSPFIQLDDEEVAMH